MGPPNSAAASAAAVLAARVTAAAQWRLLPEDNDTSVPKCAPALQICCIEYEKNVFKDCTNYFMTQPK